MKSISNTPELAMPTLARSHKGGINIHLAAHLMMDIAPYPGMSEGDLIELYWDECFVASKTLGADEVGATVSLRVPQSFIVNGIASVHYRLMQIGAAPVLSAVEQVQVKLDCPGGQPPPLCGDENQNLAPVQMPETICRKGVNPSQIKRGVPLTIEPYLNMAVDDEITLRWGDVRMDLPKLDRTDIGHPIQVWVPPAIIEEAGEDLHLEVTYCVLDRLGNNSRWAPPRRLKIGCGKTSIKLKPKHPGGQ
ncbi:hypothetical protein [Pseudomonas violetae]|jgi:hypothetical protein|uniref:Uncharacterized protein n=1 Tax=Pseudomonas violetae TaxID=2915813 RepID=A0ABT0F2Z9_9PSED|nr:hypothetical protein [Pseudomonas violetae]MCK1792382.1 hypothetical protein [Pseudomonas violetae]